MLSLTGIAKPTTAAAAAIRKAVMRPRDNYPKTGMQSAPRALDGNDPYSFALVSKIATLAELAPFLKRWRDDEKANRGLGSAGVLGCVSTWIDAEHPSGWLNESGVPVEVTVQDCQHETMQQYTANREWLLDADSIQACADLVAAILADSTLDPKKTVVNSRQLGRPLRALMQEGSEQAKFGAGILIGKVLSQMGVKNGLHYYTLNTNAGADHAGLPIEPEQESTILGGLAWAYKTWPVPVIRDAIYHGLTMLADVQQLDGSFANDAGWDANGAVIMSDPGKVMDLWIVPAIIEAKAALGPLFPPKAQAMLDRAKKLWLATGYTSPSDKNFGLHHNTLSITIGCAPEYGWRS